MEPTKPGYRTTEFWITGVPGLILTLVSGLTDWGVNLPSWSGPIMLVLYALSRGLTKTFK